MKLALRLFPVIFLLLGLPACSAEYPARVVGVTDGDTLTVLTAEKRQVKIRLAGIDAPESGQDFGGRAKQAASDLAFGKQVRIRPRDTDRYGRTVAEVILPDGRSLNREMVALGMAWWYREYARNDGTLARLEATARAEKRGLWSQPGAMPPWDWRSGRGVSQGDAVAANRSSRLYPLRAAGPRPGSARKTGWSSTWRTRLKEKGIQVPRIVGEATISPPDASRQLTT